MAREHRDGTRAARQEAWWASTPDGHYLLAAEGSRAVVSSATLGRN